MMGERSLYEASHSPSLVSIGMPTTPSFVLNVESIHHHSPLDLRSSFTNSGDRVPHWAKQEIKSLDCQPWIWAHAGYRTERQEQACLVAVRLDLRGSSPLLVACSCCDPAKAFNVQHPGCIDRGVSISEIPCEFEHRLCLSIWQCGCYHARNSTCLLDHNHVVDIQRPLSVTVSLARCPSCSDAAKYPVV